MNGLLGGAQIIAQHGKKRDGVGIVALGLHGDGAVVQLPLQVEQTVRRILRLSGGLVGVQGVFVIPAVLGVARRAVLRLPGGVFKLAHAFKAGGRIGKAAGFHQRNRVAVLIALLAVHEIARLGKVGLRGPVLALVVQNQPVRIGGIGGRCGIVAQLFKGLGGLRVIACGKQLDGGFKFAAFVLRTAAEAQKQRGKHKHNAF